MEGQNRVKDTKKYYPFIEILAWLSGISLLVCIMQQMLLSGESALIHDNIIWRYPIIQFFTDSLVNGQIPYWNPFTHGGEPFYPNLLIAHLLDPVLFVTIFFGKYFTNDVIMLFNWFQFLQSLIMLFGVYIVFRPLTERLFMRLTLVPILLFSSFMLVTFRIGGLSSMFVCAPYITFFLLRIIYHKDYKWNNWIILAGLIGLNWHSYRFSGIWVFMLFFVVGFVVFRRDLLRGLFKSRGILLKFIVLIIIVSAMMLPNIAVMLEGDNFVYPARMLDVSNRSGTPILGPQQYEGKLSSIVPVIRMPYNTVTQTGTFSTIWDFIQTISPEGNRHMGWSKVKYWGAPSEAYMYLGLLPFAIIILGMVAGEHDLKKIWMLITVGFGLLILGPSGGLHRILYYIYPPLWFIRHTHLFVLFFLFGLMYFYVLGINHIFSTWQTLLLQRNTTRGHLKRLIKNDKLREFSAFVIFFVCIVMSVYLMINFEGYTFYFICLIFAIGYLLRNDLGMRYLYAGIVVSLIAIVLISSQNKLFFVRYITFAFGIPVILFFAIKAHTKKLTKINAYFLVVMAILFTVALVSDLIYVSLESSFLYEGQKHLKSTYDVDTTIHKPFLQQERSISPEPFYSSTNQAIRYLSLIYRNPFAFSSINLQMYDDFKSYTNNVYKGLKNGSFESWVLTPEGKFLPKQFAYHQDGFKGMPVRYFLDNGVMDGRFSLLLKPAERGNSLISYCTSSIEELKGNYAVVSVWAKSQNTAPYAVQLVIHDDAGKSVPSFYKNSGEWEYITAIKYVDDTEKRICVTCNINSEATSSAYFDLLKFYKLDKFEAALKGKRWSTFLMLRKYYDLINSAIPPDAIKEMFAVGKPMFQYKKNVLLIDDNNLSNYLNQLGTEKAVRLLDSYILVDKQYGESLNESGIQPIDYSMLATFSPENKNETDFSYEIGSYSHNAFEMKVFSDKQGILYWADGYDKNWRAYVNGKEVPICRANRNFKAISLPEGTNTIHFVYNPSPFNLALLVFFGTFILCILASLIIKSFDGIVHVRKK